MRYTLLLILTVTACDDDDGGGQPPDPAPDVAASGAGDASVADAAAGCDCDAVEHTSCEVVACVDGACVLRPAELGEPCDDDGYECTFEACDGAGHCAMQLLDSHCFDALFCNGLEVCEPALSDDATGCAAGTPPEADGDGIACTVTVCDEDTDTVARSPGPECACDAPGEPCDDPNPGDCTAFVCDDDLGCVPDRVDVGTPCDDGVACTVEDVCDADGLCAGAAEAAACDDGLYCNGGEFCDEAEGCIRGDPPAVPDGLECTQDVCNEDTDGFDYVAGPDCACAGDDDCEPERPNPCLVYACDLVDGCRGEPRDAGAGCDDGVACTAGDVCDGRGRCAGAPDDARCNDAAWCDGVETCAPAHPDADAAGCRPGAPPALSDGVDCTQDVCVECEGCVAGVDGAVEHRPGDACGCVEDGDCDAHADPCTANRCVDFDCAAVPRAPGDACDDGIDCTRESSCDEDGACGGGEPDDDACSDGLFCTGVERCEPGVGCLPGPSPVEAHPDDRACLELSCDEDRRAVVADDARCGMCVDVQVYADADGDGFGVDDEAMAACLEADEAVDGFARDAGDCGPIDAWRNPAAEEICGDWVDDDCADGDAACPQTAPAVAAPDWDCQGEPPNNVYAWARFGDGGRAFRDGACFLFFQAESGAFFASPRGFVMERGRVCSSFDERLYAFTRAVGECPNLLIAADFSNDPELAMQPVSSHCRKFLYAMTRGGQFSYLTRDVDAMSRRLDLFPTLELACVGYRGWPYGWEDVLSTAVQRNQGFVARR